MATNFKATQLMNTTLIIQGGGFRTSFSAGVLDAFISHEYNPFNKYIAISGGAIGLSYFLSAQYKSYFEAMCHLAEHPDFIQYRRLISEEGMMNIDLFEEIANEKIPFNLPKAIRTLNNRKAYIVMTNRQTGKPHYHEPNKKNWLDAIIASCTLPFVTKGAHKVEGVEYMDGGWSDSLPVKWAYENGSRNILIIRTTPTNVKISQSWPDYFATIYYRNEQQLRECFENNHIQYNESIDYINNPPKDLQITQIAPEVPLQTGTYSNSVDLITLDYRHGVECGISFLQNR